MFPAELEDRRGQRRDPAGRTTASPSPGLIYAHTIFPNGARRPGGLFINYRCCECEFAFRMGRDFPARAEPYTEDDARAGIGDTVRADFGPLGVVEAHFA